MSGSRAADSQGLHGRPQEVEATSLIGERNLLSQPRMEAVLSILQGATAGSLISALSNLERPDEKRFYRPAARGSGSPRL